MKLPAYLKSALKRAYLRAAPPKCVRLGGRRSALLCYITRPFVVAPSRGHSNQREVILMADTLHELGFAVDAVDYDSSYPIAYGKYEFVIGFGRAFVGSYKDAGFKGVRALHCTGANIHFSNRAEAVRAREMRRRSGVLLQPRREVYWPWVYPAVNADFLTIIGNGWTASTYQDIHDVRFTLPVPLVEPRASVASDGPLPAPGARSFLWFSGAGALHKGLDLVLEALGSLPNDVLVHVCGPIASESDFVRHYRLLEAQRKGFVFHGFVDIDSDRMRAIAVDCPFVIHPSCSEGSASSVISCMSMGLIPLATREAGVDLGDFGIAIERGDVDSVLTAMKHALGLDDEERAARARAARAHARTHHGEDAYRERLRDSLVEGLSAAGIGVP